jgi:hypothetical protein
MVCGNFAGSRSGVNSTDNSVDMDYVECTSLAVGAGAGTASRLSLGGPEYDESMDAACPNGKLVNGMYFRRRPLVTSGALADPRPGSLGQANTRLLFGGLGGDASNHNGGRLTLAYGVDDDNTSSVIGSFFGLDQRGVSRVFASNGGPGTPVIGRPFFNIVSGTEDADPVAIPGIASGRIRIDTPSTLFGGEIDYQYQVWREQTSRFAMLVGGRYLSLDEGLNIHESSVDLPGLGVQGNSYLLSENYVTHNHFYGGEFGADY